MPLPFILAGVAVATVGFGVKKGIDGYNDSSKAEDIVKSAEQRYQNKKRELDKQERTTEKHLNELGELKLNIGQSFQEFKQIADDLLRKLNQSSSGDFRYNNSLPKHQLNKIDEVSLSAVSFLSSIAGGAIGGATAAYAVYGGVMAFGAASTGASIATLSGAAAYNATMAAIGGGAISAGGLGIAGGTAILGSAVAAPVIAVAGFAYAKHAEEKLSQARNYRNEVGDAVEKMNLSIAHLVNVKNYVMKINHSLNAIYQNFKKDLDVLKSMSTLVEKKDEEQLSKFKGDILDHVAQGYSLAAILANIITTPLFKMEENTKGELIFEKDSAGFNVINDEQIDNVLEKSQLAS